MNKVIQAPGTELSSLTALILAGGRGSRLSSVVPDRPKVMAEVLGRPFLAHQLDFLERQGLRKVVLCTGHLESHIRGYFGDRHGDLDLSYSLETNPLGTAGALALALPQASSDPVLVLNGDSLFRVGLGPFWHWYQTQDIHHGLLLAQVPEISRYGGVQLDDDGLIRCFQEKCSSGPGLINAGVYLLKAALLRGIPTDRSTSLEREVFPRLCSTDLHGFPCQGSFLDIGTPLSYAQAEHFLSTD